MLMCLTTRKTNFPLITVLLLAAVLVVAACSSDGLNKEAKYPSGDHRGMTNDIYAEPQGVFGEGGILGSQDRKDDGSGSGIGVNTYLWRAALDTVSFMPLASADPFGGVILTDWYSPEAAEGERIKLNVFIMDKNLRSDGIRVRMFKQVKKGGDWTDAEPSEDAARKLEDTILTRARQMRVAQIGD